MASENVEIVRSLYADFAEGRFWAQASRFSPDIEYERFGEIPGGPGTWRGREAFGAAFGVLTLRDGLIVRLEGYWDRAEAERAAGLTPTD